MRSRPGRAHGWSFAIAFIGSTAGILGTVPSAGAYSEVPNLVPLPPYDLQIGTADDSPLFDPKMALRFTVAVANRGPYPFDLLGVPKADDPSNLTADATQCIDWEESVYTALPICRERQSIGTIFFHREHTHWHLEQFVTYELRHLTEAGDPDLSEGGLVGESLKISFCLQDVLPDSEPPPPGSPALRVTPYYLCTFGPMGISPGWQDVYDWSLPDQEIPLDGVPDGAYSLVVVANPVGRFYESTRDDDLAFTRLVIDGEEVRLL